MLSRRMVISISEEHGRLMPAFDYLLFGRKMRAGNGSAEINLFAFVGRTYQLVKKLHGVSMEKFFCKSSVLIRLEQNFPFLISAIKIFPWKGVK